MASSRRAAPWTPAVGTSRRSLHHLDADGLPNVSAIMDSPESMSSSPGAMRPFDDEPAGRFGSIPSASLNNSSTGASSSNGGQTGKSALFAGECPWPFPAQPGRPRGSPGDRRGRVRPDEEDLRRLKLADTEEMEEQEENGIAPLVASIPSPLRRSRSRSLGLAPPTLGNNSEIGGAATRPTLACKYGETDVPTFGSTVRQQMPADLPDYCAREHFPATMADPEEQLEENPSNILSSPKTGTGSPDSGLIALLRDSEPRNSSMSSVNALELDRVPSNAVPDMAMPTVWDVVSSEGGGHPGVKVGHFAVGPRLFGRCARSPEPPARAGIAHGKGPLHSPPPAYEDFERHSEQRPPYYSDSAIRERAPRPCVPPLNLEERLVKSQNSIDGEMWAGEEQDGDVYIADGSANASSTLQLPDGPYYVEFGHALEPMVEPMQVNEANPSQRGGLRPSRSSIPSMPPPMRMNDAHRAPVPRCLPEVEGASGHLPPRMSMASSMGGGPQEHSSFSGTSFQPMQGDGGFGGHHISSHPPQHPVGLSETIPPTNAFFTRTGLNNTMTRPGDNVQFGYNGHAGLAEMMPPPPEAYTRPSTVYPEFSLAEHISRSRSPINRSLLADDEQPSRSPSRSGAGRISSGTGREVPVPEETKRAQSPLTFRNLPSNQAMNPSGSGPLPVSRSEAPPLVRLTEAAVTDGRMGAPDVRLSDSLPSFAGSRVEDSHMSFEARGEAPAPFGSWSHFPVEQFLDTSLTEGHVPCGADRRMSTGEASPKGISESDALAYAVAAASGAPNEAAVPYADFTPMRRTQPHNGDETDAFHSCREKGTRTGRTSLASAIASDERPRERFANLGIPPGWSIPEEPSNELEGFGQETLPMSPRMSPRRYSAPQPSGSHPFEGARHARSRSPHQSKVPIMQQQHPMSPLPSASMGAVGADRFDDSGIDLPTPAGGEGMPPSPAPVHSLGGASHIGSRDAVERRADAVPQTRPPLGLQMEMPGPSQDRYGDIAGFHKEIDPMSGATQHAPHHARMPPPPLSFAVDSAPPPLLPNRSGLFSEEIAEEPHLAPGLVGEKSAHIASAFQNPQGCQVGGAAVSADVWGRGTPPQTPTAEGFLGGVGGPSAMEPGMANFHSVAQAPSPFIMEGAMPPPANVQPITIPQEIHQAPQMQQFQQIQQQQMQHRMQQQMQQHVQQQMQQQQMQQQQMQQQLHQQQMAQQLQQMVAFPGVCGNPHAFLPQATAAPPPVAPQAVGLPQIQPCPVSAGVLVPAFNAPDLTSEGRMPMPDCMTCPESQQQLVMELGPVPISRGLSVGSVARQTPPPLVAEAAVAADIHANGVSPVGAPSVIAPFTHARMSDASRASVGCGSSRMSAASVESEGIAGASAVRAQTGLGMQLVADDAGIPVASVPPAASAHVSSDIPDSAAEYPFASGSDAAASALCPTNIGPSEGAMPTPDVNFTMAESDFPMAAPGTPNEMGGAFDSPGGVTPLRRMSGATTPRPLTMDQGQQMTPDKEPNWRPKRKTQTPKSKLSLPPREGQMELVEVDVEHFPWHKVAQRPKRRRIEPLRHWRNEQVVYERQDGSSLPTVKGVVIAARVLANGKLEPLPILAAPETEELQPLAAPETPQRVSTSSRDEMDVDAPSTGGSSYQAAASVGSRTSASTSSDEEEEGEILPGNEGMPDAPKASEVSRRGRPRRGLKSERRSKSEVPRRVGVVRANLFGNSNSDQPAPIGVGKPNQPRAQQGVEKHKPRSQSAPVMRRPAAAPNRAVAPPIPISAPEPAVPEVSPAVASAPVVAAKGSGGRAKRARDASQPRAAAKDALAKERETAAKEAAAKEAAAKEAKTAKKAKETKEANEAKEAAAKEAALKEVAAKENAAREADAKKTAARKEAAIASRKEAAAAAKKESAAKKEMAAKKQLAAKEAKETAAKVAEAVKESAIVEDLSDSMDADLPEDEISEADGWRPMAGAEGSSQPLGLRVCLDTGFMLCCDIHIPPLSWNMPEQLAPGKTMAVTALRAEADTFVAMLDDQEYVIGPGDHILVRPGMVYGLRNDSETKAVRAKMVLCTPVDGA